MQETEGRRQTTEDGRQMAEVRAASDKNHRESGCPARVNYAKQSQFPKRPNESNLLRYKGI